MSPTVCRRRSSAKSFYLIEQGVIDVADADTVGILGSWAALGTDAS